MRRIRYRDKTHNGLRWSAILLVTVFLAMSAFGLIPAEVRAAPADAYWVGGTGVWSDAANHWAVVSDGAPGAGNLPDKTTNVHFDANSFGAPSDTVTLDASTSYTKNLDWTGATNTPEFIGNVSRVLQVWGSLTLIPGMTWSFEGGIYFYAAGAGQTITTAGQVHNLGSYQFRGAGVWTLQDDWVMTGGSDGRVTQRTGTVVTDGNNIDVEQYLFTTASVKTFTLGSDTVTTGLWDYSGTNLTMTANTGTIIVSGTGLFGGGGIATYNDVDLVGTVHTVSGSNTFETLTLAPATTQTITFTDGTTQTVTTLVFTGSAGDVKTLQGSGVGGWGLSQAAGTVNVDYVIISRSTAGGGATFNANGVSIDGGNNVGWNFTQTVSTQVATGVTANNYIMNGTLTDLGGDPATTTVFFEFGPTAALGSSTTPVVQTTPGAFSSTQGTPTSDTVIFYRAGTTNAGSTAYGAVSSISVPAATGGMMIRTLLRLILASAILVTVLRVGVKGTGVPFLVIALLGVVAFALIDAMIIALF